MKFLFLFGFIIIHVVLMHGEAFLQRSHRLTATITPISIKYNNALRTASLQSNSRRNPCILKVSSTSGNIELSAMKAVGKLLATCGLGMTCTKTGLIDKNSLSVMSKLIFGLFQPTLLFVNIASTVAKLGSQGAALWFLPAAALAQILVGMLVGKLLSSAIYGSGECDEKNHLLMCTAFGNSGPLPLVFADALLKSHPDTTLLPQTVGFISLYLLGWSPLFWIFGPTILQKKDAAGSSSSSSSQLLSRVFSPPVLASILGVVVGSVPALRNFFMMDNPSSFSPGYLLFEAMRTISAGYLPCVLLVLAGSLLPTPSPLPQPESQPSPDASSTGSFAKLVGSLYLSRFLLMPLLVAGLVPLLKATSPTLSALLSNKALLFVLLMQSCMPSAQNSTVILQLLGDAAGSAKIAQVLMAVYVLGIPAISFWLARIMASTGIVAPA